MMTPTYQLGGGSIYRPAADGGKPYLRLPRELAEKLGDPVLIVLNYLDTIMGDVEEVTILTDQMIQKATGLSLRTIQRVLQKLEGEALGQILRIRRHGYRIILRIGFMLDKKPAENPPAAKAPKAPANAKPSAAAAAPPPPPEIDLEYAKYAVEFSEKSGWRIILDGPDNLKLVPIEGMDQVVLSKDFKVVLKQKRASVLAFLKGTHQRE